MRTQAGSRPPRAIGAVLLLLAIAITLGGCGCDLSFSCGENAGTGLEGLTTYTDSTYGYSFRYPGDWEVRESHSTEVSAGAASVSDVSAFDPDGAADSSGSRIDVLQVSVYQLAVAVEETALPEIKPVLEGLMEDFARQSEDYATLEPLSEARVGELNGYEVTCSFTMGETPVTSTFYFLFDGDIEYQLLVQAAEQNWEADRQVFDAFVASFTPGSEK
ncbi:MAG: hypothetical protein JXA87_11405 [Thermoleophilia bacterium]|nr:hypothetical protein [Thermoleophilia bacterium]